MNHASLAEELADPFYAAPIKAVRLALDLFAQDLATAPEKLAPVHGDEAKAISDKLIADRDAVIADVAAIAKAVHGRTTSAPIASSDAVRYLTLAGRWTGITLISDGMVEAEVSKKVSARTLVLTLQHFPELDLGNRAIDAAIHAAINQDLIAVADRDALIAMAQVPAWTSFSHREPDFNDILIALGVKWEDLAVPTGRLKPLPAEEDAAS